MRHLRESGAFNDCFDAAFEYLERLSSQPGEHEDVGAEATVAHQPPNSDSRVAPEKLLCPELNEAQQIIEPVNKKDQDLQNEEDSCP